MKKERLAIVFLMLSPLCENLSAADVPEQPRLRTNPFVQPQWPAGHGELAGAGGAEGASIDLELRGTLTAGSDPMANIGGVILEVGEEVNGHRLVSVGEWEVIVEKDGVLTTLTLHSQ